MNTSVYYIFILYSRGIHLKLWCILFVGIPKYYFNQNNNVNVGVELHCIHHT